MIDEKLNKYKMAAISKKLNVPIATLYRWRRGEGIDNYVKFIEFLYLMDLDPKEYVQYHKKEKQKTDE